MLGLWVLVFSLISPLDGLLKSAVMNVLQNNPSSQGYGGQLVYGTLGFGIFSFVAGLFADRWDIPTFPKYSMAFFLAVPLMLPLIPLTFWLFKYTQWGDEQSSDVDVAGSGVVANTKAVQEDKCEDFTKKGLILPLQTETSPPPRTIAETSQPPRTPVETSPPTRTRALINILTNGSTLMILMTCFVVGFIFSTFASFFFLTVREEMEGSKTSMGVVVLSFTIVGEE